MNEAIKKSEEFHIEQAMLDDKLQATDWEATNDEIMELVARESYIQWLKDNEKRHNFLHTDAAVSQFNPSSATCSAWEHEPARSSIRPLSRRSAAAMSTPPHSPSQTKFSHHFKTSPQTKQHAEKKNHQYQQIYDDPYSGPAYPSHSISTSTSSSNMDKPTSSGGKFVGSGSGDPSKSSTSVNKPPPSSYHLTASGGSIAASAIPSQAPAHSSNNHPSLISQDIYDENMPLAYQFYETKSIMNELPPDVFGLGSNEWTEPTSLASDSDILASVLAASQQEYLESLKAKRQQQS